MRKKRFPLEVAARHPAPHFLDRRDCALESFLRFLVPLERLQRLAAQGQRRRHLIDLAGFARKRDRLPRLLERGRGVPASQRHLRRSEGRTRRARGIVQFLRELQTLRI